MTIPRIFEKPYTRVRLPVYMDHRRSYVPNNDGVGRQSTRRLHLHALRPPRTYEYIYTIRTHPYTHLRHHTRRCASYVYGRRKATGRRTGTRTRRTSGARRGIPGFAAPARARRRSFSDPSCSLAVAGRPVRSPVTVRPAPQSQAFGTASPNGTVVVVVRS
jgi:hypothetical protein